MKTCELLSSGLKKRSLFCVVTVQTMSFIPAFSCIRVMLCFHSFSSLMPSLMSLLTSCSCEPCVPVSLVFPGPEVGLFLSLPITVLSGCWDYRCMLLSLLYSGPPACGLSAHSLSLLSSLHLTHMTFI